MKKLIFSFLVHRPGVTYSLLYLCTLTLIIWACRSSGADAVSDPLPVISGHTPKNKDARYITSAQGEVKGKLIKGSNVGFALIQEYDSSKHLLNDTRWNTLMRWIQHYDAKGNLIKLETFQKDSPSIYQVNTYDRQDNLLEEFRIEYTPKGPDSILYAYQYQYAPDSLSYVAFRTNNGDTVTRFTMERKGNHIYKTEEAYPYRGFTSIIQHDITENKEGKPVRIIEKRINSSDDHRSMDTTVSTSRYVYDTAGRLIEEHHEHDILSPKLKRWTYRNGMVGEMTIDGKTFTFDQFALPKPD